MPHLYIEIAARVMDGPLLSPLIRSQASADALAISLAAHFQTLRGSEAIKRSQLVLAHDPSEKGSANCSKLRTRQSPMLKRRARRQMRRRICWVAASVDRIPTGKRRNRLSICNCFVPCLQHGTIRSGVLARCHFLRHPSCARLGSRRHHDAE